MNPENTRKKDKFLCRCCAKTEEFNSEKVIFDYFGREFTEYEYVIENLAIRPAPKKLLDLVPVHSTNISKSKYISQTSSTEHPSEPEQSSSTFIMSHNLAKGEGDFQKPKPYMLKIRDDHDDFISFRALPDDSQVKTGENSTPKPYNPYRQSVEPKPIKDVTQLRKSIKSKEYRTTKQILSDLYEASEESLNFTKKTSKDNKPIPNEIKETIEMLRFKQTLPEFYTRTEKKLFHTPGVYFAEVQGDAQTNENKDRKTSIKSNNRSGKQGESSTTVEILNQNRDTFSQESPNNAVNSTAQTEVSKAFPSLKKDKKNLKWKIIINKHASNSKS